MDEREQEQSEEQGEPSEKEGRFVKREEEKGEDTEGQGGKFRRESEGEGEDGEDTEGQRFSSSDARLKTGIRLAGGLGGLERL